MDEKDKDIIFKPLPDNKEAEFKKSMPQLSNIVDKVNAAHTRSYGSYIYTQKELHQLRIVTNYINRIFISKNQTLEYTLIYDVIPQLSIIPFLFEGNMFYVIQTKEETPYPIFSETDIHPFFRDYSFKTNLPRPNEQELTAILFWHHNKIDNIKAYYIEVLPVYSYQIQSLRTLPNAFMLLHQIDLHNASNTPLNEITLSSLMQSSNMLLKAPNANLPQEFNPYQYMADLLIDLKINFKGRNSPRCPKRYAEDIRDYRYTLRVLFALSNGNLSALSAFHNMIASIFLGKKYVEKAVSSFQNVSILLCKDTNKLVESIECILNSSFSFSKRMEDAYDKTYLAEKRPTYTKHPISYLSSGSSETTRSKNASTLLKEEVDGCLVNISIQIDKNDVEKLNVFSIKKTLTHEDDAIFKGVSHSPCKYYVHITEDAPTNITHNMQIIELMGDITDKVFEINNLDAAVIVLLSIFNFFNPTPLPNQEETPSSHPFATEEEIVRGFIEDLFDDTTSKFTAEQLEEAIEKWINENNTTENFDPDISKSKNDGARKKIAENIGISMTPYTITEDIETAFKSWEKSVPFSTGAINIIESMKKLYHPLFYIKYHKAKSRIRPDAPERNVKVFYGLALKAEKLHSLPQKEQLPELPIQERKERFFQYYKTMIQNFLNLQPKIYNLLNQPELEGLGPIPKDLVKPILIDPSPNTDDNVEGDDRPPSS